ncbi:hypothetical protein Tco_0538445 [Tanacetum coccineum]
MSVKHPTYVNLTSSSEEQPNERTHSPHPRKKSLSPPQAPSKSISHPHVAPPPKLRFVIPIKQEPQELSPLQISPNNPYVPPGPSNPSPPPRIFMTTSRFSKSTTRI